MSRPRRSHRDRARAVEPTRTPRLLPSRRFARDTSRNTAVSPGASQPCGTAAVFFSRSRGRSPRRSRRSFRGSPRSVPRPRLTRNRNCLFCLSPRVSYPACDGATWTWKEYYDDTLRTAKSFMKLGVGRFESVSILGFNSPEWLLSNNSHFIIVAPTFQLKLSCSLETVRAPAQQLASGSYATAAAHCAHT